MLIGKRLQPRRFTQSRIPLHRRCLSRNRHFLPNFIQIVSKQNKKPAKFWFFQKNILSLHPQLRHKALIATHLGEMVEWSITVVLKTTVPRGTGGSNPSLSATNAENQQIKRITHRLTHQNCQAVCFFSAIYIHTLLIDLKFRFSKSKAKLIFTLPNVRDMSVGNSACST